MELTGLPIGHDSFDGRNMETCMPGPSMAISTPSNQVFNPCRSAENKKSAQDITISAGSVSAPGKKYKRRELSNPGPGTNA